VSRGHRWAWLAAAVVALPATALAQRALSASGAVTYLDYCVEAGFGVERFSGITATAAAEFRLLRGLDAAVSLELGHLDASTSGFLNRSLAQLGLTAKIPMGSMVVWQAGVILRSYGTAVAHQRWMLATLGAELRVPFPTRRIEGVVRGTYFPMVEERGLPRPSVAFSGTAGLWYRIAGTRLGVLGSVERYEFPAAQAPAREEQLARLSFELAVDLTRRRPVASLPEVPGSDR